MGKGLKRSDGSSIVPKPMNFHFSGNNTCFHSVKIEKYFICSLLRAEISFSEIVIIYRKKEMRDGVVEAICKVFI